MQLAFGLLALAAAAVLQATLISRLTGWPRPDLVLVLVLAWSMTRGVAEGTIGGVTGGLALDLMSAGPFGLHAGLLGLIGSLTALGEANLYRGNLPLYLLIAALATLTFHGGALLLLQAAGLQAVTFPRFLQFVVPTALLNSLLMPLAFSAVQRAVGALSGWRQLDL